MSVFVWIQYSDKLLPASCEALGLARELAGQLGGEVMALVFGQNVGDVAQAAFHYGADTVIKADDPTLAHYRFEPYAALVAKLVQEHNPAVVLAGATTSGREVLAGAAADLDAPMVTDVTELTLEGDKLKAVRPVLGGKVLRVEVVAGEGPQFVTLRSRAFKALEPDTSRSGNMIDASPVLSENDIATKVESVQQSAGTASLTDASVIVSGGRGVGGPDGFGPIRELAEALGGAVGASRAAVDAGWIPYEHQVGQTGKVVSPDLYIAVGISGAIQHQAGMRTAKVIIAVNKDADAPIFKLARYGIVGDLFEILPALTAAFRTKLG